MYKENEKGSVDVERGKEFEIRMRFHTNGTFPADNLAALSQNIFDEINFSYVRALGRQRKRLIERKSKKEEVTVGDYQYQATINFWEDLKNSIEIAPVEK